MEPANTITIEEYRDMQKQATKTNKYRNKPVTVDGIHFDSTAEFTHHEQLKLRLKAGEITHLERQPEFPIDINGCHICTYIADFRYFDVTRQRTIIEDKKSPATRKDKTYRLKKKLVEAYYQIEIEEV